MLIKIVNRRAVSPLISTLLIMAITMLALSVTLGYTQATLTRKNGETDFESAKSFMKNLCLQVDDVAWVRGRVDTVHFTAQYGQLEYLEDGVQYKIDFYDSFNTLVNTTTLTSDVFLYNMPVEKYYLDETYYEPLIKEGSNNLFLSGPNAPVARVFGIQSSIAGDSQFLRIALVPALRWTSYEVTGSSTTHYVRVYYPDLQRGYSSDLPKSIVLTGIDVTTGIHNNISRIDVAVTFPQFEKNYDNNFFKFNEVTTSLTLSAESQVEMYSGQVRLDYGA